MKEEVLLKAYGFSPADFTVTTFGSGLINNTWVIKNNVPEENYILQRINKYVFKQPEDIAFNIRLLDKHFKKTHPDYMFVTPLPTAAGEDLLKIESEYFRLFNFVKKSQTVDVLQNVEQAYEAAVQFGRFTSFLNDFEAKQLRITIPNFHNLSLRFQQFQDVVNIEKNPRKENAIKSIQFLLLNKNIVNEFESIAASGITKRVIHHDTKISNVLFDDNKKGLCVIDLDTVMPGYFISDVGDMMRTYLSPVSEEEKDITKMAIRDDYFEAIVKGYLSEMRHVLSSLEIKYFVYAGKFMIYMQALRFLTDYLCNDIYFGQRYDGQNLVRTLNQIQLLKLYTEKESLFEEIVSKYYVL